MNTVKMNISDLKHPDKNPRKHSAKQIEEMKRSIEMFGQVRPAVVDENNVILCGNGMVRAMREMGKETVDVLKYNNLTEAQKKKLMIADNQIGNLGTDDMSVLEEFIRELDGDLDVPGYDEATLAMLVADSEEATAEAMSYGVFTAEQISEIRSHEGDEIKPIKQTYQEPEQPVQRTGISDTQIRNTPQFQAVENNTATEEEREFVEKTTEQYVICPKCGEKIWLS